MCDRLRRTVLCKHQLWTRMSNWHNPHATTHPPAKKITSNTKCQRTTTCLGSRTRGCMALDRVCRTQNLKEGTQTLSARLSSHNLAFPLVIGISVGLASAFFFSRFVQDVDGRKMCVVMSGLFCTLLPLVRRPSVSRFPRSARNTVIAKAVRQPLIGLSRQVLEVVHSNVGGRRLSN